MTTLRNGDFPEQARPNGIQRMAGCGFRLCKSNRIVCAAVVLLLVATLFYGTRVTDPVYEGKPLSKYLAAFGGGLGFGG